MSLIEYEPGQIWLKEYPIRYAGCRFNSRMTIIRLNDGSVMLHSPCEISGELKEEIEQIGKVAFIVAPGNFHWLHVESCQKVFTDTETWICPGIERKAPEMHFEWVLGDKPDSRWENELDQVFIRGSRIISEVVFLHRASKTLIVVDVIEYIGPETPGTNWLLKFYWKCLTRMWKKPKPAPEYQMSWKNKRAAKKSFERILSWDFDRIILSHGDIIEKGAKEMARRAWHSILKI